MDTMTTTVGTKPRTIQLGAGLRGRVHYENPTQAAGPHPATLCGRRAEPLHSAPGREADCQPCVKAWERIAQSVADLAIVVRGLARRAREAARSRAADEREAASLATLTESESEGLVSGDVPEAGMGVAPSSYAVSVAKYLVKACGYTMTEALAAVEAHADKVDKGDRLGSYVDYVAWEISTADNTPTPITEPVAEWPTVGNAPRARQAAPVAVGDRVRVEGEGTGTVTAVDDVEACGITVRMDADGVEVEAARQQVRVIVDADTVAVRAMMTGDDTDADYAVAALVEMLPKPRGHDLAVSPVWGTWKTHGQPPVIRHYGRDLGDPTADYDVIEVTTRDGLLVMRNRSNGRTESRGASTRFYALPHDEPVTIVAASTAPGFKIDFGPEITGDAETLASVDRITAEILSGMGTCTRCERTLTTIAGALVTLSGDIHCGGWGATDYHRLPDDQPLTAHDREPLTVADVVDLMTPDEAVTVLHARERRWERRRKPSTGGNRRRASRRS